MLLEGKIVEGKIVEGKIVEGNVINEFPGWKHKKNHNKLYIFVME